MLWSPLSEAALDSTQRLLLYLGVVLLALVVTRPERWTRLVIAVYAMGATLVIGYGLAGRLLPGVMEQDAPSRPLDGWSSRSPTGTARAWWRRSASCCASPSRAIRTRGRWARAAAAGACVPLGLGTYLSYSRGALGAVALGLLVLLATAPMWPLLRAPWPGSWRRQWSSCQRRWWREWRCSRERAAPASATG